jgi:hypothetical protein
VCACGGGCLRCCLLSRVHARPVHLFPSCSLFSFSALSPLYVLFRCSFPPPTLSVVLCRKDSHSPILTTNQQFQIRFSLPPSFTPSVPAYRRLSFTCLLCGNGSDISSFFSPASSLFLSFSSRPPESSQGLAATLNTCSLSRCPPTVLPCIIVLLSPSQRSCVSSCGQQARKH